MFHCISETHEKSYSIFLNSDMNHFQNPYIKVLHHLINQLIDHVEQQPQSIFIEMMDNAEILK